MKAIREEDCDGVRVAMCSIWNCWPSDVEILTGDAVPFALEVKSELLVGCTQFLEAKGWTVQENEKHGLKITDPTGAYWSANSPLSVQ